MDNERLDLRKLPVWERPGRVFDVFDSLPPGGSLTVVTDNEPRGLATQIEQARKHQLTFDPCRVGDNEWLIQITRSLNEPEAVSALSVLKRAPVFGGLQPAAVERIAAESSLHSVRRGQAVIVEGSDWPYLGVVYEGVLALGSGNGHARPRIFLEAFPFEVFGEVEFFDGAPANARVSVLSKVARYLRVPRRALFDGAHQPDPALLFALGRVCAQRSRDLMQALATQGTMPIIARIAQALVPFAPPEQGLAPAIAPLPNMTQSQIAATAGTVKEVAARAIAELELRGLLKRERGHIRFLDRQKLLDLIKEGE